VGLRISFVPDRPPESAAWTLRIPAGPERGLIAGLDAEGEISGLAPPDFDELDRRMLERRGAYQRRLSVVGAIEIAASGERAKGIVLQWLSDMLAERELSLD
jgi:hypothetical protein